MKINLTIQVGFWEIHISLFSTLLVPLKGPELQFQIPLTIDHTGLGMLRIPFGWPLLKTCCIELSALTQDAEDSTFVVVVITKIPFLKERK